MYIENKTKQNKTKNKTKQKTKNKTNQKQKNVNLTRNNVLILYGLTIMQKMSWAENEIDHTQSY